MNIDVADVEEGVRFYTEGLGLRLRRRLWPHIVELEGASCAVFLTGHATGTRPFAGAAVSRAYERHWTPVHLDLVVADLDTAVRRAEAAGARAEGDVREYEWGRFLPMADPFENGFCLLQFLGRGYDAVTPP